MSLIDEEVLVDQGFYQNIYHASRMSQSDRITSKIVKETHPVCRVGESI